MKYVQQKIQKNAQTTNGFTLIEMMTVIVIISIFSSIAVPSLKHLYLNSLAKNAINQISGTLRLARSNAVSKSGISTLCPSKDGINCDTVWHEGILLFQDNNGNTRVDNDDEVVFFKSPLIDHGTLTWNGNRDYIQFSRRGMPKGTIGSFTYCPKNRELRYGKALILNFQGKLRIGKDQNNDGIIEAGNGQNIICK